MIPNSRTPIDFDTFSEVVNTALPHYQDFSSPESRLVQYPQKIALMRAYNYCCCATDSNHSIFDKDVFVTACTRFAIDNPFPSISLRLQLYGNSRDVMKILGEAEKVYGKNAIKFDKNLFTEADQGVILASLRQNTALMARMTDEEKEAILDASRKETVEVQETPYPNMGEDDSTFLCLKDIRVPANKKVKNILSEFQAIKSKEKVVASKMKIKIKSLQSIAEDDPHASIPTALNKKDLMYFADDPPVQSDKLSPTKKKKTLTETEFAMSSKQLIVPSFETTARLFQTHLLILREVKYRVDKIKQAYFAQMDKRKTWQSVD
jgi:hypothetical protein